MHYFLTEYGAVDVSTNPVIMDDIRDAAILVRDKVSERITPNIRHRLAAFSLSVLISASAAGAAPFDQDGHISSAADTAASLSGKRHPPPEHETIKFIVPNRQTTTLHNASKHKLEAEALQPTEFIISPLQTEEGEDISWPQCKRLTNSIQRTWGYVGLTHGRAFEANTCVTEEASLFTDVGYYVNSGLPDELVVAEHLKNNTNCPAGHNQDYCYGYAIGDDAVGDIPQSNLLSASFPIVIDVETANSWQLTNPLANIDSIQGEVDALRQHTPQRKGQSEAVEIYSTPLMWQKITGGWQIGLTEWLAIGKSTNNQAVAHCTDTSFTGGKITKVQYVDPMRDLDIDIQC